MEARLLAGVVQTDTYIRLQVAEELTEYFKKEEHSPEDFPELERLIAGLGSWMSSSNSKVGRRREGETAWPRRTPVGFTVSVFISNIWHLIDSEVQSLY